MANTKWIKVFNTIYRADLIEIIHPPDTISSVSIPETHKVIVEYTGHPSRTYRFTSLHQAQQFHDTLWDSLTK